MRFNIRVSYVTWLASTFATAALAAVVAGCETGGGPSPEVAQASKTQQEANAKKIEEEANAAAKKTGATVKFHRKPGAVGGN